MPIDYSGMTLNERLYEAGLMVAYDSAVKEKDRNKLFKILRQVALEGEEAAYIINTVLQNPKKYGH